MVRRGPRGAAGWAPSTPRARRSSRSGRWARREGRLDADAARGRHRCGHRLVAGAELRASEQFPHHQAARAFTCPIRQQVTGNAGERSRKVRLGVSRGQGRSTSTPSRGSEIVAATQPEHAAAVLSSTSSAPRSKTPPSRPPFRSEKPSTRSRRAGRRGDRRPRTGTPQSRGRDDVSFGGRPSVDDSSCESASLQWAACEDTRPWQPSRSRRHCWLALPAPAHQSPRPAHTRSPRKPHAPPLRLPGGPSPLLGERDSTAPERSPRS